MYEEPEFAPLYSTVQSGVYDLPSLEYLDVLGQEFSLSRKEIRALLDSKGYHAVATSKDYEKVGYCLFTIKSADDGDGDQGGDIHIERLSFNPSEALNGINSLVEVLRHTPGLRVPVLTINWPEYDYNSHTFKALIELGFKAKGLIKDEYFSYGEYYDAIKLELPV
ncbi:MAG: hypothetical protein GY906_04835 [bacterium]|nr:hypothetical protein [bacterium]